MEVSEDGTKVTGKGEPESEVIITDQDGKVIGKGEVDKDGNFEVELDKPTDGNDITIGLEDGAGNKSPEVTKSTPDKVAPDAPT
ncbi:Ig-like domain-containing protein, partial [Ignatzschineria indica]|uniref:Ig-like domain-containing protein n=1 Tax=Ignatzschineria indica TaxID=472583 RepID=UPI00167A383E